ncbi:MAG: DUF6020 family protein [Acetatifactor sp.]
MKTAMKTNRRQTCRRITFCILAGILIGFCYAAGRELDKYQLVLGNRPFLISWLKSTMVAIVIVSCVWFLLYKLEMIQCGNVRCDRSRHEKGLLGEKSGNARQNEKPMSIGLQVICMVFLFLCWLPALLSMLPGAFSYDAAEEWLQVQSGMITSHHPVAHVLLLGGLTEGFYKLIGSYNVGITIYSVIQMLFMAFTFSATIRFLREYGIPRIFCGVTLIFYGISPIFQLFSICATKDIYFTCSELFLFMYLVRFCTKKKELLSDKRKVTCFGLAALGTMIFRKNGVYIVALMAIILAVVSVKEWRKYKKSFLRLILISLIPYIIYTGPVYKMLRVTPGGVQEMLSVPLQQMAMVYYYNTSQLPTEDLDILYQYVEEEALRSYSMTCADPVKKDFNGERFKQAKMPLLRLWIRWGVQYPLTYVSAFLINTVDFWYPAAVVDGYYSETQSSLFEYQVKEPGKEIVLLPGLHKYYEFVAYDRTLFENPFWLFLVSPGWYFVCWLCGFLYLWCERKYHLFVPILMFALHFLTVLLGPMALVRYVLIFYFAYPLLLAMLMFAGNYCPPPSESEEDTAVAEVQKP